MSDEIIQMDLLEQFCEQAVNFWEGLNSACADYAINTPERISQFLAQIAHESAGFHYTEELASGQAYEGRTDLGNTEPGDGVKFKGRGLIQITGRANYAALSKAFNMDFLTNPATLSNRIYAAASAGWYWNEHKLNSLADLNDSEAFQTITRRINGGLNGLDSRIQWWNKAKLLWPSQPHRMTVEP